MNKKPFEKLTKREKSWLEKFNKSITYNSESQAKAWCVIFDLCVELGVINLLEDKPSIVKVCEFIYNSSKQNKGEKHAIVKNKIKN